MRTDRGKAVLLTAALAAAIAVLTLTPVTAPAPVAQSDKLYHVIAFAGLALPVSFYVPRWLPGAILLFALFGGLIEIVQPFVGRERSLWDWLGDVAGIALGIALGLGARALLRRR